MISSRSIKRDAAPENAKPIKNATRAAVDARTRATCRSKDSSAERISEPSQKPSSWTATTPTIRPNATSSSVIRGPLSQSHALGVHDSFDATLTHRFQKGAVVALRLVGIFDRELAHCDHADAPHPLPLLRTRHERPRCRCAAEERDELAPFQSIELHSIPASQGRIARISNCQRI